MSKTTDPNLAKFLGTDRIRSLSDEELCQLVREYYRLPAPGQPPQSPAAAPPTAAPPPDPGRPVVVNPSLADTMADASKEAGRLVRGLFSSLFKKRG